MSAEVWPESGHVWDTNHRCVVCAGLESEHGASTCPGEQHGTTYAYDEGCRCVPCVNAQQQRLVDASRSQLVDALRDLGPVEPEAPIEAVEADPVSP